MRLVPNGDERKASSHTSFDPNALSRNSLRDLDGCQGITRDPEVLEAYRHDQSALGLVPAGVPVALVRPRTTADVQHVIRVAGRHQIPVVPRGAGSGLSGGANAIDGCMVVSLEQMRSIVEVDPSTRTITVQPGVINADVAGAAAEHELWYPPDPASWEFSTIGGNVATNAGGLCCLKYGVTRDSLLEIEAVLADGSIVRLGNRTRKGVAGYDLKSLFCGSEGTLGVITEVTSSLRLPTSPSFTLVASFASLREAGLAIELLLRETQPSVLELMDATTIKAVEQFAPMGLDDDLAALIFARSDAGPSEGRRDVERMQRACEEAGATLAIHTDEEAEGRMLTVARRLAFPALESKGSALLDDVAVPVPAITDLLDGVERIADEQGILIGTFGHAGDGNMHPTIVYDPHDSDQVRRAKLAFELILDLTLSLGGTITGEHGVGLLKQPYLAKELGRAADLNVAIKSALDPNDLLNPGKAI